MPCSKALEEQADWHKRARQGCLYASYMSKSPNQHGWKIVCIDEEVGESLLLKINEEMTSCIKNQDIQALSIVLPQVKTNDDLIRFVKVALELKIWNVQTEEINGTELTLAKISVNLNERTENGVPIQAWILGFGNFDAFASTRKSPHTELAMTVKSKQFFQRTHGKFTIYQYKPDSQHRDTKMKSAHDSHLADIHLVGKTDNVEQDKALWRGTQSLKRRLMGLHLDENVEQKSDDSRTKAKVTFVIQSYK